MREETFKYLKDFEESLSNIPEPQKRMEEIELKKLRMLAAINDQLDRIWNYGLTCHGVMEK